MDWTAQFCNAVQSRTIGVIHLHSEGQVRGAAVNYAFSATLQKTIIKARQETRQMVHFLKAMT